MNRFQRFAKVAALAVLIGTITQSNAQNGNVRLGLSLSPSLAWMTSNNQGFESGGLQPGARYGLFGDFTIFGDQRYNFSTGVIVSSIGGKLEYPVGYLAETETGESWRTTTSRAKYNLSYINLPLQIKLRTDEIGYSYFYGVFGAEVGYNLSATVDETIDATGVDLEGVDIDDERYRFEGAQNFRTEMVIGGGMERVLSGQTRVIVGITYHRGINNVIKGRDYELYENGDVIREGTSDTGILDRDLKTNLHYITLNIGISF